MQKNLLLTVFVVVALLVTFSDVGAYDSDIDGVDSLVDAINSLKEVRPKETIHTLQILTGMNPSPDVYFSRSITGNIVMDLTTGLMWQDSSPRFKTETEGIAYCITFELDGHDDWQLPTFDELQTFFKGVDADTSFDLRYWGTFSGCTAAVAIGGYVKTPVGADVYGGEVGDRIYFSGGAAARCVKRTP